MCLALVGHEVMKKADIVPFMNEQMILTVGSVVPRRQIMLCTNHDFFFDAHDKRRIAQSFAELPVLGKKTCSIRRYSVCS